MEKSNDDIRAQRHYMIVKSNDIIQKARYNLSIKEIKTLAFIISKIKPTDSKIKKHRISIQSYCKVCGIDWKNGGNYESVKETLISLAEKCFWVDNGKGGEVTMRWLSKVEIYKNSGTIYVQLDEDMHKYLVGLFENYAKYELISTLPMKSAFSFRMYEILKSYAYRERISLDIDELKRILCCEDYRYQDFRRRVLDTSCEEINHYTDIEVKWEPGEKEGRRIKTINFDIRKRDNREIFTIAKKNEMQMDGQQINIFEYLAEKE